MRHTLKVLDLFSGIGGFSLGLERAGFETAAFAEADKAAQAVLRKHWPDTPIYSDVRDVTKKRLEADGIGSCNVVCGGFPCQDISLAGKRAGLEGARSGLWWEFHRIIDEFKPEVAIIENVSALRSKGLEDILQALHEIGYDAEWHCIPASHVGAPHQRDRIWIVAYPSSKGLEGPVLDQQAIKGEPKTAFARLGNLTVPVGPNWSRYTPRLRVGDGVSRGVDRIKQCGNAVVPHIPEAIGKALLEVL